MDTELRRSAARLAEAVRAGRTTARAEAEAALARRAAYDAVQPQAWIARASAEAVLAQAERVDARVAAGEQPPLAGVSFAVKDNIDVAGFETTAACPSFAYRPEATAPIVQRLLDAGAILLGKTNLDQFATGLVGVRSPYGAPGCVSNRAYVSGGSSSGSAVAVGAGVVSFALGTDTAGSGRVPAAINHLVGLKPTPGRWSTRGLVPACRTLDCPSVFANDVADAALVDAVLCWFDAADPFARPAGAAQSAPGRLGVAAPDALAWFGDEEAKGLYAAALAKIEALGFDLRLVDIEFLRETAKLLYGGPWVAERAAAMEPMLLKNPAAIHPAVRAALRDGQGVTGVAVFRGQYKLAAMRRKAEALWTEIDALVLPTAAPAYRIAEILAEPEALNANLGAYTNFVNLLDMSAVAVPAGVRASGVGFGVTLIGPRDADAGLLAAAERLLADAPPPPALDLSPREQGVLLAVVGAHLHGMPLHWQLTSRNARLVEATHTAPAYRLYAMETVPPKPALVRSEGGAAIALEVYALSVEAFGSFVTEVPPPLAIGTVELADGREVKGFVAEPRAMDGAREVTAFGGWRAYMASRAP